MQERGFTEDFQLFGNDLLWLQGKEFLRPMQFKIAELHRFLDISGNETVVFGIQGTITFLRGILLNHYKNYTNSMPAALNYKLLQMDFNHLNMAYEYVDVTFQRY